MFWLNILGGFQLPLTWNPDFSHSAWTAVCTPVSPSHASPFVPGPAHTLASSCSWNIPSWSHTRTFALTSPLLRRVFSQICTDWLLLVAQVSSASLIFKKAVIWLAPSLPCLAPSSGLGVHLAPISTRCVLDEILGNQHQLSQRLESQKHTYLGWCDVISSIGEWDSFCSSAGMGLSSGTGMRKSHGAGRQVRFRESCHSARRAEDTWSSALHVSSALRNIWANILLISNVTED